MSNVAALKAKHATLMKILAEAKAERRKAEDVLADMESRQGRASARRSKQLDEVAARFPALRSGNS